MVKRSKKQDLYLDIGYHETDVGDYRGNRHVLVIGRGSPSSSESLSQSDDRSANNYNNNNNDIIIII